MARKLLDLQELGRKNRGPPAAEAEAPSTGSDVQVRKTQGATHRLFIIKNKEVKKKNI